MFLLDLTHTSHTRAQTGVQRVCRGLFRELKRAQPTEPVTFDPFLRQWRPLQLWELETLDSASPATKRGAQWPASARWGGRLSRWLGKTNKPLPRADGLVVPEIFSPAVARALPDLFAAVHGPRVALFHDAIALKFPELSPPATVARFPAYLQELQHFDGIAAVSKDSAQSLIEYWDWLGIRARPAVTTLTLPLFSQVTSIPEFKPPAVPIVLSVGSIEGRKNHLSLLTACEKLWAEGVKFELRLIGLAHRVTGRAAVEKITALKSKGRPISYAGAVPDSEVNQAYTDCSFTVYPSIIEGFGLPVLESLAHGKPCICSANGALGESAVGGGCLRLPAVDSEALAAAIKTLISDQKILQQLADEARQRKFKSWPQYVTELTDWMDLLPPR